MALLSLKTDESLGVQTDTANELSDGTAPGAVVLNNGEIFPLLFDAALATLTTATGQVNNPAVSLSGYSAATPNGTAVDITGLNATAKVQDIGFAAFNGVLAIDQNGDPLKTTDGHYIYLYTYPGDNNILLAREGGAVPGADPNGALVFAAYLNTLLADGVQSADTTTGDVGATSAKVWMVQYQALHNVNPNDPNDVLTLGNDLGVFVNSLQDFSLAGAPSGQNLFLMFGDGTPAAGETAIIVTGKHPINQSDPSAASLTSGDTVNTGQGGGMTTIGSNNQMIDPNEGMYFSFVTLGADSPPVTVPNLDQNEADVEANMKFDSFLGATEASFAVVQLQPPKGATLKITAIDNQHSDSTGGNEIGVNFIDGLGDSDDKVVSITSVTLTSAPTKKNPTGTTHTFSGDGTFGTWNVHFVADSDGKTTVTIAGATAGDTVDYTTATDHNRVLIDNIGNASANLNAAFDIGAFKLATGNLTPSNLGALGFVDSAPTAGASLGTGSVTNDETAGVQAAPANDTTDAAVAALFTGVTNTSTQLTTAGYAQGSAAVIDASSSVFGADGAAAANSKVYSLTVAVAGVDSGVQTDDGTHIMLFKEGDLVVGRIGSAAGAAAFAVAIDAATGVLSMAQYSAVKHGDPTNPNDSLSINDTALQAVVTVTDGDGDQSTASVNIGNEVKILDDGPTAGASLGTGSVTNDETAGVQNAAGANDVAGPITAFSSVSNKSTQLAAAEYAQGSAAVIDSSASSAGSDGQASRVYSLEVSVAGVDSGVQTDGGTHILLYKEGALVIGRIGSALGAAAFAVAIDASTGVLSMAQYSAVKHANTSDPNDSLSINDAALLAVVTVTDGDGDWSRASANIGNGVRILDDGPSLAFGNDIGTGTLNPQFGYWSMNAGADTLGANGLDIAMTGFHLVKPDNTVVNGISYSFTETAPSPDVNGAYHFTGSVTGDLDNNAATPDITEHFTMTAYANGTYAIDLQEGFKSTTVESTASGTLDAGGPDHVRTLTVGSDSIVFFTVKALASTSDILTGIGSGASDPTEAQLQISLPPYINVGSGLNVSTSGIGNDNNNLDGDSNAAITVGDESFIANPGTQFSSAKVFIDNSVTGYDFAGGERLYYRVFYIDGTDSGQILVNHNVATTGHLPVPFTIDGGGKLIDAIQLTMATGVVKIPYIEFITQTNSLADGLKLDFTATIADKDGDTASSDFVANLSANALASTFDFMLNGTAGVDAFNVDLSQVENKYQVNGFNAGDKLVLLGDAGSTYLIDNSGADSIVSVSETTGSLQTTTITVVGVDMSAADIVHL